MIKRSRLARSLITALLAVCLLMSFTITAGAAASSTAIYDARNGVVCVVALYELNGEVLAYSPVSGSAFGVGTAGQEADYFVTNAHVVEEQIPVINNYDFTVGVATLSDVFILKDDEAYNPTLGWSQSHMVRCTVVYRAGDGDADLAVLKPSESVGRIALPLLENEEQNLLASSPVYAIGYPGISQDATAIRKDGKQDQLYGSASSVTITSGVVSKYVNVADENNVRVIEHDATINGGNSGGPLLNADGAVVAVNTWGSSSNQYWSIKIDYVMDVLDSLKISYDTVGAPVAPVETPAPTEALAEETPAAEESPAVVETPPAETAVVETPPPADKNESNGSNNTLLIIAIAAAAVVIVVIAVVLVIVNSNNKKRAAEAKAAAAKAEGEKAAAARRTPVAVGAGATGGGSFQAANNSVPVPGGTARSGGSDGGTMILRQPEATALLVNGGSITRVKNNETVHITSDSIIIGRDETADLWIKDNKYIGTRHVKLTVRGGVTYITDLNSKNGTFVNGVKAQSNVETALKDGDKITLANEDFLFKK